MPHYYPWVNHVRVATYAAVFYAAATLVAVAFTPGVNRRDAAALQEYRHAVTIALWAGIGPAALAGAIGSYLRLRYFLVTVLNRWADYSTLAVARQWRPMPVCSSRPCSYLTKPSLLRHILPPPTTAVGVTAQQQEDCCRCCVCQARRGRRAPWVWCDRA